MSLVVFKHHLLRRSKGWNWNHICDELICTKMIFLNSFYFLEHLNIVLFELARTYHAALHKVDVSEFGSDEQGVQDVL